MSVIRNSIILYILLLIIITIYKPELIKDNSCKMAITVIVVSIVSYYIFAFINYIIS